MMHRAWISIVEVPCCFSRSYVKFQGHTALKIIEFDANWAFPDCNSSLNSPMAMKCCTKLETAKERCPIVLQGHPSNFKVTRDKTSPILTQIGRFRTIGRSQLSNPSDLPCFFTRGELWPSGIVIACVCLCVCVSVNFFCPDDNSPHVPATIIKFGPKNSTILLKVPIVFGVDWPWTSRSNLTSFQNFVYLHLFYVLKYLWDLHKNGSFLNCCPAQMIPHIYRFHFTRWHGRATDRETV